MKETENQFQSHGLCIKNLETQVGHIASALILRTIRAFPSLIKSPAYTFCTKSVESCKSILLRSGIEY